MTARGRDAVAVSALLLIAGLVGVASVHLRPDQVYNEHFLRQDEATNIALADSLLAGKWLYRDVLWPYGAVGPYLHTAAAACFGNTLATYVGYFQVFALIQLFLLFLLLRRAGISFSTTLFVLVAGVIPCMFFPIALLGAYTSSTYMGPERCCLILTALVWEPASRGNGRRAALLGAVLGLWQTVRFGGAFFAGAAVVLLDLLVLRLERAGREEVGTWFRQRLWTLAAFLAAEGLQVAAAFSLLPPQIAWEALWPSYMLNVYTAMNSSPLPPWEGLDYFMQQQLTPLVALVLGLMALWRSLRRTWGPTVEPFTDPGQLRLLVPLLYFLVCLFGLFRHHHHVWQNIWAVVPAGAIVIERAPRLGRVMVAVLWFPCLAAALKADLVAPMSPKMVVVTLPNGEQIYTEPEEAAAIHEIVERFAPRSQSPVRPVLFVPIGGGFDVFYGIPRPSRHIYLLPGMVRPYDEAALLDALRRSEAVVVFGSETEAADPRKWGQGIFSDGFLKSLGQKLGLPEKIGDGCWVIPIRR
jgi:hypothetical protein